MNREKILQQIEESGVVAVLRLNDSKKLPQIIEALAKGGLKAMEITMTTPNALDVIAEASKNLRNEFIVGVGTVLDGETARMAILAGAEFVVSPVLNIELIKTVKRYGKIMISGAFTPTEIVAAWENGADMVKVFPATALGPKYFQDIKGPLPQIKLTPTGGVSLENTAAFIKSGACCVGVGSALLDKKMIDGNDWEGLAKLAAMFRAEVEKGRK
ncbi:MAG: bifunctional 4-hydroxy-2-oxoglutarate aldolase/2-dehydro-3-deoxy-phosphogluconate aldolase [Candidatus Marinimicrobia bacterium]|nr:bifunctional 4-hydroxy-2-oxoglutarate aldolase/2-dehydro-3-deoxy-phosphogluconate aldolase [Candidatus Neomarinimicrobiota bacterium]